MSQRSHREKSLSLMNSADGSGFFRAWLVCTVFNQFNWSVAEKLRRLDILQVVSRWTFFVPTPGMHDYFLFFRDKDTEGRFSEWNLV